ncbi:MAG: thioredoxin family protein [Asticcacaulis sp.]|uniref:protein-disulfide reductase DsbD family protein n=1 Tax=Asticcacaulis sp. TaxID=1872648 RepID=UPI003F7CA85C
MVRSLIRFGLLALAMLAAPIAAPAAVRAGHMTATLQPVAGKVAPGGEALLALTLTPDAFWHTYWLNPGDTGLPTDISLSSGAAMLGDALWPAPQKLVYDGVVTYGYDRAATVYVELRADKSLKSGARLPLALHVDSLVCRDACEPVSFDLKTSLDVSADAPTSVAPPAGLPIQITAPAAYAVSNGVLSVDFALPGDAALRQAFLHPKGAYVFSEDADLIAAAAPQSLTETADGFRVSLPSAHVGALPTSTALVIRFADGQSARVIARAGALSANASTPTAQSAQRDGVGFAVALAFLGGLILNLMPCVFPVLSMKLLALTRAGHDHRLARREALVYGLGAVLSFVALALMLDVARGLGAMVGWGFQLQSPFVTAGLSLLMFMVGLNLSGLFEIGGSLQSAAGAQDVGRHPYLAAFMTGVLAVVVAAPCSAPFMATATGVALLRGGFVSLAIFSALGLGFAAPFVAMTYALTWSPALARLMPRPGVWMDRLRQVLAIPMYLAAVWMGWVFWQQAGVTGLGLLILGMALIAGAVVLRRLPRSLRAAASVAGLAFAAGSAMQTPAASVTQPHHDVVTFAPDQLAALRAQGQPVLVDMTAAWCLTCKVNERIALSDARVQASLKAQHIVYMVGDWTHRDAQITRYLTSFGRSGVPLYVYYAPGKAPQVLPQLLTPGLVLKAIKGA